MDEQMTADLLSIDCELRVFHCIKPISKAVALGYATNMSRVAQVFSFSIGQYEIALESLEESDADFQTLHEYSMSVIMFCESQKK